MRTWWAVALASMAWACGSDPAAPGGNVSQPVVPDPPPAQHSLWPLTQGSSWTYRITDPVTGTFPKDVTVQGPAQVSDKGASAIAVVSVQPHIEEHSWQIVVDGKVLRLREEDRKNGQPVRDVTWQPSLMMKALSDPKSAGWTETVTLVETERNLLTGAVDEKEKVYAWTVEAVNQTVTTPAGTFTNAIKLKRSRPDKTDWETRTYWLVPGVGKVREEGERLEELTRYDVK